MRVSVIIPTYNRADLLRDALESVFAQTYQQLQIIVVDDGSTDHTDRILTEFGSQIHTIRLGRSGISAARNAGIEKADGDYIAFLDSDDIWSPEKIDKQLASATVDPNIAMIYTDATQFGSKGTEEKSFVENFPALRDPCNLFNAMIMKFAIPLTSTVMIRTSFLKETGLQFPVEIGIGEDLGLFLKVIMAGGKLKYLPEKLTGRRMHDSNISANHCRRFEQRKLLYTGLLRQYSNLYTSEQKQMVKAGLRDARYRVGECLWEKFDLPKAREEFFHAISLDMRGARAFAYGLFTLLPEKFIATMRSIKTS